MPGNCENEDLTLTSTFALDDIIIGIRHRRDIGDIGSLARSVAEVGLLHPIVIRPDGVLIAGARRLAACKALGGAIFR
jgi:ParB family transcriptional regulator, chromosome partitioning protein